MLDGKETEYVNDCLKTGWISSSGKYVNEFEAKFGDYCGAKYAVAVCNGTVALHLALVALGIGVNDEVIIPNFTMIASAFAVCYTGAAPVFVEVNKSTWNIDVEKIEAKITSKTKAIMVVSIFGQPCNMERIWEIAKKYNLKIVEDAAESHGASYKGIKTGNLADITTFSFFANKNLTTGEGGMVVTNDSKLYDSVKYHKNLCFALDAPREYIHHDIGFNYRISNIHAAIGLAQVEKADKYSALRIKNALLYKENLIGVDGIVFQEIDLNVKSVYWMNGILLVPELYGKTRDELTNELRLNGIDTRPFFSGMNVQPSLIKYGCDTTEDFPVTENLSKNGFYLPSASSLEEEQIVRICNVIKDFKKNKNGV